MNGDSSRCPHPEVLAAFVAGKLSGEELKMTADHLLDCEDCPFIVREAARVAREEQQVLPRLARRPRRRLVWWLGAAAAAVATVAFLTWRFPGRSGSPGIRLLVDATP